MSVMAEQQAARVVTVEGGGTYTYRRETVPGGVRHEGEFACTLGELPGQMDHFLKFTAPGGAVGLGSWTDGGCVVLAMWTPTIA